MMEDTLWTLADVARYLKMNERTVAKLAAAGQIPGAKIASQWRFKPSLIEEWLVQQIRNLSPEQIEQRALDTTPRPIAVSPLIKPEACLLDLNGSPREDALRRMAERMSESGMVQSPDEFIAAVLHREYLCSTGIGDGIALPHARHAMEKFCPQPCVGFGRSTNGIDFDSYDGRPVQLIFLIGSPDDETHLRIMAQISRLLRDDRLREGLLTAESVDTALRLLERREREMEEARVSHPTTLS